MRRLFRCLVALCTLIPLGFVWPAKAQTQEKRIALVIGNAGYQTGALETSANDAGLIAQTLQAAGFDVVGARDLDQDALRRALRDFLSKASSSGPDTVAFIYLSGYGLQLEGENYFLPVDTKIGGAADVAAEALRVSDYVRPLAALKLKASILILDAARRNPFAISGAPLAGGLALVEPSPGTLVAFNAAPGTIAPNEDGPYGAYAQALAEMMRQGGLALPQVFERARLRVSDMTKGAQLPWFSSRLDTAFLFFERSPDAPACRCCGSGRGHFVQIYPRSAGRRRLYGRGRARYVASLRRIPGGFSRPSPGKAGAGHHCRTARGDHLATHLCREHAECLLVVPAPVSAWSARRGCAATPRAGLICAGAARLVRPDRL